MDPYVSELRIFSFGYAPTGWLACNGQILQIVDYQILASLLGATYGGDGRTTFGLPNLQGSVPMHVGNGLTQGRGGGEQAHALVVAEIPSHSHPAMASSAPPAVGTPSGNFWPTGGSSNLYGNQPTVAMSDQAIATSGGDVPHNNMAPYQALNICIATTGLYPNRD